MIENLSAWLFWTGLPVLCLGTLVVLAALLADWFRRRVRGRTARCPRCWYDMQGAPGLTCPECGRTARSARSLLKSRRRWFWAAVGLVLVLAGTYGISPAAQRINWLKASPTWMLMLSLDDPCPAQNYQRQPTFEVRLAEEVWRREALGELSQSQIRELTKKQMAAVRGPVVVHTRGAWPAGEHVWALLEPKFQGARSREVHIRPPGGAAETIVLRSEPPAYISEWIPSLWGSIERELFDLGPAPEGATQIVLETEVFELGQSVFRGPVVVPVKVRPTIPEVMRPLAGARADEIRAAIERNLWIPTTRDSVVLHRPPETFDTPVALALRINIRDGDETVAWTDMILSLSTPKPNSWGYTDTPDPEAWRPLNGNVARLTSADLGTGRWTAMVTASPVLALRVFEADQCWQGELTLPLREIVQDRAQAGEPRRHR